MKRVNLFCCIFFLILLTESQAYAWWSYLRPGHCPIHESLALLSLDKMHYSNDFKRLSMLQKAYALAEGANTPDKNKKLDHEATFRVQNTLCAAVNARDEYDALKRLAIGFHYLADNGDATAGTLKEDLLFIACDMLVHKKRTKVDFRKDRRWKYIKSIHEDRINKYSSVKGLVRALRSMAKSEGKKLRIAYRNGAYEKVEYVFMNVFSFIRASQNRLVDLYYEELMKGNAGKCRETQQEDPLQSILGSWEFGRNKDDYIGMVILTSKRGKHGAYVIDGYSHPNESYWAFEEPNTIIFLHESGEIVTRFHRRGPNYWEGAFIPPKNWPKNQKPVTHYLRRK